MSSLGSYSSKSSDSTSIGSNSQLASSSVASQSWFIAALSVHPTTSSLAQTPSPSSSLLKSYGQLSASSHKPSESESISSSKYTSPVSGSKYQNVGRPSSPSHGS